MSRLTAARRPEHAILGSPGRDPAVTAATLALPAVAFAAAADHGVLAHIQRVDAWLRLMVSGRAAPVTVIAKLFNLLGLVHLTLPARIAIAGYLPWRRRWWHMAAFVATVVASEVLIGTLKNAYDRTRPPGSLVATSGAPFPSGHAIAGILLGTSCALLAAVVVDALERRWQVRRAGGARGPARAYGPATARRADRP